MATDFIQHNQVTPFTVRALWYLNNFFYQQLWETGLAFEKELRQLNLDYSFASLKRIDELLTRINTSVNIDERLFFASESNQNFIFLLTFYCGEFVGRVRGQAPIWYDYKSFVYKYQQLKDKIPKTFAHCIIAQQIKNDCYPKDKIWFPLMILEEKLFAKNSHSSVYQSIRNLLDQHQHIPDEQCFTEEISQSLGLEIAKEIERLPQQALGYLQQIPTKALLNHPVYHHLEHLNELYQSGRCIWAVSLNQINLLEDTQLPIIDVIYDPKGRTDIDTLHEVSKQIAELKQQKDIFNAGFLSYLEKHKTQIVDLDIPKEISTIPLKISSLYVWKPHLPNAELSYSAFPILYCQKQDKPWLTILPAYFWRHTEFYHYWLKDQPAYSLMYFNHILTEPEYWQAFSHVIYPASEQLSTIIGQQFKQLSSHLIMPDDAFHQSIQKMYQFMYNQHHERLDIIIEPLENISFTEKVKMPNGEQSQREENQFNPIVQQYDFSSALAELSNEQFNQRLGLQPLLNIDKAIHYPQLNTEQANQLIEVLFKGVKNGNTNSMLYLAYLYLVGKYVSQSVEQATDLILAAINAGDWRGYCFKTELYKALGKQSHLIIEQYEYAIAQGHPTIHEKMKQFIASLTTQRTDAENTAISMLSIEDKVEKEVEKEPTTELELVSLSIENEPSTELENTPLSIENIDETEMKVQPTIEITTQPVMETFSPEGEGADHPQTQLEEPKPEQVTNQGNNIINLDDMTDEQRIKLYEMMRDNQAIWKDIRGQSKLDFSKPMVKYSAIAVVVVLLLLIVLL